MEWTETLCLKLIEHYRDNPMLWDTTDKNYKLPKKKTDVWLNIAKEFECGEGDVKRKIESLLTSYRRELRREAAHSTMGSEELFQSKWFAFNSMQFLRDKIRPKQQFKIENISDFSFEEIKVEPVLLGTNYEQEQNEDDETFMDEESYTPTFADRTRITTQSNSDPVALSKIAGRKREAEDPRVQAAFDVIQGLSEKRTKKNDKTECALYAEYIASQLEKFDENTRACVKHQIGNILFQAEMGRYKQPLSSEWSTSSMHSYVSQSSPSSDVNFAGQYQKQQ